MQQKNYVNFVFMNMHDYVFLSLTYGLLRTDAIVIDGIFVDLLSFISEIRKQHTFSPETWILW